jgi:hypothetical protein
MAPKIHSGQLCTVVPADPTTLVVGDIVLCKVKGAEYLHLVNAIQDGRFQIGNNRGFINGWVAAHAIYGRLLSVAD